MRQCLIDSNSLLNTTVLSFVQFTYCPVKLFTFLLYFLQNCSGNHSWLCFSIKKKKQAYFYSAGLSKNDNKQII